MRLAIIACLLLAACAQTKPQYTPRLPCQDPEPLSSNETIETLAPKYLKLLDQYQACRKARRVNPRKDKP